MRLGILNPSGALALLAVGVLIVLHLFGRRRRPVPVGTLFLWRQVPSRPLDRRRFRPTPLFWAQLALLLALIAGYLRPFVDETAAATDHVRLLVVLDGSASMQAREAGGTRFELARRRARTIIAQLLTTDEVMLVVAAERPHVVLAWTADHAAAQGRLEALAPVDTPTNLGPALELALSELGARSETQVVVLTDLPRDASGIGAGQVALLDWVQIGRTDDNVAVAGLAVEAPPFRPLQETTATVLVRNYGGAARRIGLDATVGGEPWTHRELTIAAHGSEQVLLTDPPAAGELVVALAADDALAVDDRAFGWIDAAPPLDAVLVSESPALAATFADVVRATAGGRLGIVAPSRWAEAPSAEAAVAVFDRVAPEPATMPALYVEPPEGNPVCPTAPGVDGAAVVDWDDEHPTLRGLDALEAVTLLHAVRLATPDWARPVALAAAGGSAFPFLVAGERRGRRVACLGAAPIASSDDLPLLLLLLGTLRWLEEPPDTPLAVTTGVPVLLGEGDVTQAEDAAMRVAGNPPVLVALRVGTHQVGRRRIAANLFDERESDIGRSGGGEWRAAAQPTPATGAPAAARELGRWLYLAGAMLLGFEWLLWRRQRGAEAA